MHQRTVCTLFLGSIGQASRVLRGGVQVAVVLAMAAASFTAVAQIAHFGSSESVIVSGGLHTPPNVAVDPSGNVYIPDTWNHRVLKVTPGSSGYTQTTIGTKWSVPWGIAIDAAGNLYVSDTGLNQVVKLTPSGSTYTQSVVGSGFNSPRGLAVDSTGNLYITDGLNNQIVKETLAGGVYTPSVVVTGLASPCGIAVDSTGNLYIADTDNHRVLLETLSGGVYTQSVFTVSGLDMPFGVSVDQYNNVYVVDTYHNRILKETLGSNGTYTQTAIPTSQLYYPDGVAIDQYGNVYVADSDNGRILKETLSGVSLGSVNVGSTSAAMTLTFVFDAAATIQSTTVLTQGIAGLDFADAGTGTCKVSASFKAGDTCSFNVTFKPTASGTRTGAVTFLTSASTASVSGYIYGTGVGPQIAFVPGTETTIASTGLNSPNGPAVDAAGNIYFADYSNNRVVKLTPGAGGYTQTTIGSGMNQPGGVAVDGAGNLYISDTQNYRVLVETLTASGYVQSVLPTAGLSYPYGVAVDGSGNIYITDTTNNRILKESFIAGAYTQTSIGTGLLYPYGVAVDGTGNVYIADTLNNRVVKETWSAGTYTQSVIGGGFALPYGIAVDGNGAVYIADTFNLRVAKETPITGGYWQTTVAGSTLAHTYGVAVDAYGNVYVADTANNRILKEDLADAPNRSFSPTAVGASSNAQTQSLQNIGNATMNFPVPATGTNPSVAANFSLSATGSTPCPIVSAGSATGGTLAAQTSCQLQIAFTPAVRGTINGALAITDDSLNAAAPSYATQSLPLKGAGTQAVPSITWSAPSAIGYGTALGSSQLNATALVAGTFSYSPALGTILAAGSQTLAVTFTPTDTTNYATATASVTLVVNPAAQTISFSPSSPVTFRAAPITLIATGGASGNAVTFSVVSGPGTVSGNTLNLTGAGTIVVTASQAGNANYAPATPVTASIVIAQATQSISFSPSSPVTFRAAPITLIATGGGSGNAVTFSVVSGPGTVSGNTLTITGAGTIVVTASQAGNANYAAATPVTASITIAQAAQSISFSPSSPVTFRAAPITLIATGGASGNAVTFSVVSGPGTVSGNTLTMTGAGTIVVTANQAGNANYLAATPITASIVIAQATPTVNWTAPAAIVYGTALSGTQLKATSTLPGTFAYQPAAGTVLAAGAQTLSVTFSPTDSTDYTTATVSVSLTVNQAASSINWTAPAAINYGTALSATQLSATSTVAGSFSYSPALGAVLSVGTQTLAATFTPTDAVNYKSATASVSLTVTQATPSITWTVPAAITYGTALSATQLSATSPVAGSFSYSPALGAVLSVGTQTLAATFTPTDTANYKSATASVTLSVTQATPSITWTAPAAITYGTALSATQLNAASTVAGTLAYTPALGTVLSAGAQTLSATFTPTDATNYTTATSTVTLTVNQAAQTITFAAPASPVTYGAAPIALTATGGASGQPVTFTVSGPGSLSGSTLTITGAGTVTVTANQTGNANYAAAKAVAQTIVVNQAASTTALVAATLTPTQGLADLLTATVTGAGTLTGNVVFSAGSSVLCTAALSGGAATCSYSPATPGAISVTAQYQGDASHTASSASVALTVATPYDAALSVQYAQTQLVYPGATNVTVCVTSAASAAASGTVNFYDGASKVGSVALQGNGCAYWYITPGLSAGTHLFSANYSGDKNNTAGNSAQTTLTVAPTPTTLAASCTSSSLAYGQSYQCTVTASANSGPPTGVVSYSLDGGTAQAATLSAGNAAFTLTGLATGTHQVAIGYAQQGNYAQASALAQSFTVQGAAVAVAVTPSAYAAKTGATITLTAAVSSTTAGRPNAAGSVSFYDGSTLLATVAVDAKGTAATTTAFQTSGAHTVQASYSGAAGYAAGTGSANLTISAQSQTISFTGLPATAVYGTAGPYTLAATATSGLAVSYTVSGPATLTGSTLTLTGAGTVAISATQAGNSTYAAAAAVKLSITVSKAATTTALTAADMAPNSGTADLLTATVSGAGSPGGSVVFSSGSTTLCTSTLSSGVATCSYTPAATGGAAINAKYQGDANNQGSYSSLTLNVAGPVDSQISLQFASTTLVYPGATNITVCVTSTKKTAATGTVKIVDGVTTLTTQTLQGNGCAYWYITPGLAIGAHPFTAVYSGDKNNPAGTSASTVITVNPVPVTLAVALNNASIVYGISAKMTVTATSAAGAPAGSITYSLDGGAATSVALSSGNAAIALASPAAGTHQVVISYAQQTNYAAATPQTVNFTVTAAPVSLTLTPSATSAKAGAALTFKATVTSKTAPTPNSTGSVTFLDGATVLATVAVDAKGTASYSTSSLAAATHTITGTYAGSPAYGSATATATVNVTK